MINFKIRSPQCSSCYDMTAITSETSITCRRSEMKFTVCHCMDCEEYVHWGEARLHADGTKSIELRIEE